MLVRIDAVGAAEPARMMMLTATETRVHHQYSLRLPSRERGVLTRQSDETRSSYDSAMTKAAFDGHVEIPQEIANMQKGRHPAVPPLWRKL